RATDNLEYVSSSSLLLQGFAQFLGARLHLVEQPHVLDRDHRLVGEGLEKVSLSLGERTGRFSGDRYCSDRLPVAKQRHRQDASIPRRLRQALELVLWVLQYVWDIDDGPSEDRAIGGTLAWRPGE